MIKKLLKKTLTYKLYRLYLDYVERKYARKRQLKNEAFKKEGEKLLRCFSEALMSDNIVFWLEFGTLLGYYREHDFIKHDFDLDTGAWYEDHDRIKAALEKNGFERIRYYYVKDGNALEECYKHKDFVTTVDIFYFFNKGELSYCYGFMPLVSMRKKKNLNKIVPASVRLWEYPQIKPIKAVFKGISLYVPDMTDKHLIALYGETFMTPIPNFPVKGRPNLTEIPYEEMPACAYLKEGYV